MAGDEESAARRAHEAQAEYYRLKSVEVAQRLDDRERRREAVENVGRAAKATAMGTARLLGVALRVILALAALAAFVALTKDCAR